MSRENNIEFIVLSLAKLQRPGFKKGFTKDIGLSHAQLGVIALLSHYAQSSVKDTADYLGISQSAVTQLADPLAEKGYITRANDPSDRRVVRLELTNKGRQLMHKIARLKFDGIRAGIDSLSDSEVDKLHKLVAKMSKTK